VGKGAHRLGLLWGSKAGMGRALLDSTRLRPELSLVSISGIDISYAIVAFAIVFFFLVGMRTTYLAVLW
jgi:hypothetical protein